SCSSRSRPKNRARSLRSYGRSPMYGSSNAADSISPPWVIAGRPMLVPSDEERCRERLGIRRHHVDAERSPETPLDGRGRLAYRVRLSRRLSEHPCHQTVVPDVEVVSEEEHGANLERLGEHCWNLGSLVVEIGQEQRVIGFSHDDGIDAELRIGHLIEERRTEHLVDDA